MGGSAAGAAGTGRVGPAIDPAPPGIPGIPPPPEPREAIGPPGNRIRDSRCVVMARLPLAGVDFRRRSAEIGLTSRLEGRLWRLADGFGRCRRHIPSKYDRPVSDPRSRSNVRRPRRRPAARGVDARRRQMDAVANGRGRGAGYRGAARAPVPPPRGRIRRPRSPAREPRKALADSMARPAPLIVRPPGPPPLLRGPPPPAPDDRPAPALRPRPRRPPRPSRGGRPPSAFRRWRRARSWP